MRVLFLSLCLLLGFHQPAHSQPSHRQALRQGRAFVATLMREQHIPGFSIAVAQQGRIVWREGFGYADLDNQVPVTPESRFRIGSVSKSVTAVGLGRLLDAGRVELQQPAQRYLPAFPAKRYPFTLYQLAGHTAGIRHYRESDPADYIHKEHYASVTESLSIFRNDSLLFAPGTRYSYSSYGYVLLSAAMEQAAGQEFPAYLQQQVFGPLQMTRTLPDYQDSVIVGRTSYYQWSKKAQQVVRSPFEDVSYKWAGGGLLSTPTDLARLGLALLGGGFLKPETIALLTTSQHLADGKPTGYGLGFRVGTDGKARRIIHHGGVAYGGRAFLLVYPDQQLVIAVTTNLGNAQFGEKQLEQVADLFIK